MGFERGMTMFRKRENDRSISIDLRETRLRVLIKPRNEEDDWELFEAPVPQGYVEDDVIKDEVGFYDWLKEQVKAWQLKREQVRYFVPDSVVMMKMFDFPEDVAKDKLRGYVQMELGQSIKLPFENPIIDIYDPDKSDQKATLFAVPAEEVMKLASVLDDVHLDPTIGDIRALSAIRYFNASNALQKDTSYMLVEWLMTGIVVTIYRNGVVEFLRYQTFEKESGRYRSDMIDSKLVYKFHGDFEEYQYQLVDQVTELERIMTFYRFSIHKGEVAIDEIFVFGESLELDYIEAQMMDNPTFDRIRVIKDQDVSKLYRGFGTKDISLIGLALKGGQYESRN